MRLPVCPGFQKLVVLSPLLISLEGRWTRKLARKPQYNKLRTLGAFAHLFRNLVLDLSLKSEGSEWSPYWERSVKPEHTELLSIALKFQGSTTDFPNNFILVILYLLPEPQQMKKVKFHHPSCSVNTIPAFIKYQITDTKANKQANMSVLLYLSAPSLRISPGVKNLWKLKCSHKVFFLARLIAL